MVYTITDSRPHFSHEYFIIVITSLPISEGLSCVCEMVSVLIPLAFRKGVSLDNEYTDSSYDRLCDLTIISSDVAMLSWDWHGVMFRPWLFRVQGAKVQFCIGSSSLLISVVSSVFDRVHVTWWSSAIHNIWLCNIPHQQTCSHTPPHTHGWCQCPVL